MAPSSRGSARSGWSNSVKQPPAMTHAGSLASGCGRLFSAAPDALHAWDRTTRHRTGKVPGFNATCLHPRTDGG